MALFLNGFKRAVGPAIVTAVGLGAATAELAWSAAPMVPPPPATVSAVALHFRAGTLRAGTVLHPAALGVRVFPDARRGFALATVRDVTYPAATSNRGTTWRVNGPAFHLPAAQAPLVVTQVGAAGSREYFAWGGPEGGQAIDVTADGGRHWWQAILGDVVLAVVGGPHGRLTAVAQRGVSSSNSSQAVTWVYVSRDGGRHWLYTDRLGAP